MKFEFFDDGQKKYEELSDVQKLVISVLSYAAAIGATTITIEMIVVVMNMYGWKSLGTFLKVCSFIGIEIVGVASGLATYDISKALLGGYVSDINELVKSFKTAMKKPVGIKVNNDGHIVEVDSAT